MGSSGVSPERAWDDILDDVLEGKPEDEMRAARELWDGIASDAERRTFLLNQLDGVQPEHGYDPPSRVLGLKVLDPAMGSGHFLVGALDYITTRLAAMLNEYADSPVFERIRQDRAKIVESLRKQGIKVDPAKLTDEKLVRRLVMKKCLYGVDLNPLAVELSKLSLWLHAFTAGAPLSFLDHHIKCGNSLVGVEVEEAEQQIRSTLWGGAFKGLKDATGHMLRVASLTDASFEEVEESRRLFNQASEKLEPYKRMLDLWVSEHFGNEGAQEVLKTEPRAVERAVTTTPPPYTTTPRPVSEEHEVRVSKMVEEALERAELYVSGKRPFHWELEFPEVFFKRPGQGFDDRPDAGFDAVVGNPPYVRQEQLGTDKEHYEKAYEVYHGVADIYVYFYERGLGLLKADGLFGMITSNKYMRANYGGPLREFLAERCTLQQLIDFGDLPVFGDVTAYPVICIAGPGQASAPVLCLEMSGLEFDELQSEVQQRGGHLPPTAFQGHNWSLTDARTFAVLQKMNGCGIRLGRLLHGEIYRGVLTGLNEAFIIDAEKRRELVRKDPKSAQIIKPLVAGKDIKRYHVDRRDTWLIFTRRGINIDEYPSVREHLREWREHLEPKDSRGQPGPGRKPGQYEWYEIQDTIDYYEEFRQLKLLLPDIADRASVYWDRGGLFATNTVYFTATEDKALCALLNARLVTTWYARTAATYRGGYLRFFTQDVERIPIRRVLFTTPEAKRREAVEKLSELYKEATD